MQKKAILSIYGVFSIFGLLSAVFGVLVLVLPITKGEATVVVDFPNSSDPAQTPLTEKDKQAVFKALGQIIDQPSFGQAVTKSGYDSVAKLVGDEPGRVAGDWTEKIKIQPDAAESVIRVSVNEGEQNEKKEVAGVVAQVLAMRAPDYIGEGIIAARAQTPYIDYLLPGWMIADLIVAGLFFFFAGSYGFVSEKTNEIVLRSGCLTTSKRNGKTEEIHDARFWLQKFLDENRNA